MFGKTYTTPMSTRRSTSVYFNGGGLIQGIVHGTSSSGRSVGKLIPPSYKLLCGPMILEYPCPTNRFARDLGGSISASGTFETCRPAMTMSASGGRPEAVGRRQKRRD